MAIYARLDSSAVELLAHRFGLGEVESFSVMDGGLENTSYCVETSSSRYILTVWDQKSIAQVTHLANLLLYLTDQGIRTSQVIVPPQGPSVVLHDGKPVMFKRYIEGSVQPNLTGKLLTQLGEEMARLHQIAAPSYVPNAFPYGRSRFFEVTSSNLDHAFIPWLSEKSRYLQERLPPQLPTALIHGDLFYDNVIVQGDQLRAIIDFEEVSCYHRNFDLGMAIVGACRDQKGISFEKARCLIQGVQHETTLPPIEQDSLKTCAVYAAVATSFWRFRQYHLLRPEPQLSNKHVEMQTLADTISEYPDSFFKGLFTATSGEV